MKPCQIVPNVAVISFHRECLSSSANVSPPEQSSHTPTNNPTQHSSSAHLLSRPTTSDPSALTCHREQMTITFAFTIHGDPNPCVVFLPMYVCISSRCRESRPLRDRCWEHYCGLFRWLRLILRYGVVILALFTAIPLPFIDDSVFGLFPTSALRAIHGTPNETEKNICYNEMRCRKFIPTCTANIGFLC
jgi:hypothetical protein